MGFVQCDFLFFLFFAFVVRPLYALLVRGRRASWRDKVLNEADEPKKQRAQAPSASAEWHIQVRVIIVRTSGPAFNAHGGGCPPRHSIGPKMSPVRRKIPLGAPSGK